MSSQQGRDQEKIVVDLGAIMEQLALLRRSIERLQALVNELSSMIEDLRRAREAVDTIASRGKPEVLVPLSSRGAVFAKAKIISSEKFVVHLGGDVYGELGPEETSKILLKLEGETSASLSRLTAQLNKELEQYNALQQILAAAQTQGREETRGKQG